MLHNTTLRFGLVSILLHWLMAVLIIGLFALGWYMVELTYYDKLYNTLPFLHVGIGIILAILFVFRAIWRGINPVPEPIQGSSRFEVVAAKLVHWALYGLIAIILLSGYLIPTANGSGINVLDLFEVPATITSIPRQEDINGWIHEYLSYLLMGLVVLHALAALKHHFINKDNSLRRMLGIKFPAN